MSRLQAPSLSTKLQRMAEVSGDSINRLQLKDEQMKPEWREYPLADGFSYFAAKVGQVRFDLTA